MTPERAAAVRGWAITIVLVVGVVVAVGVAREIHGRSGSSSPPSALEDPGVVGVQAIYVYQMSLYANNDWSGLWRLEQKWWRDACQYDAFRDGENNGDYQLALSEAAAVRPVGVPPDPQQISIDGISAIVSPPGTNPATYASALTDANWGSWSTFLYANGRWNDNRPTACGWN